MEDAIQEQLIKRAAAEMAAASYAIALTGAGISTESGIPDFRGPSGVWTKNPDAERRAYRSYERFLADPKGWWKERLNTPSALGDMTKARPNVGHYALVELEKLGVVRCVITQNVDALHEKAGSQHLLEYHGNSLKLRCTACGTRFKREDLNLDRLIEEDNLPPYCPQCGGVVKTDGVAFGEPIPSDVANQSLEEAWKCDLMLICGTSAVVYPFAELPRIARQRSSVTIIEVNADPTPLTHEGVSSYLIRGKTGDILPKIAAEVKRLKAPSA